MLTISEAAALLGLSNQRVNRLAEAGQITRVARGLFDRISVERYRTERGSVRGRTWAEHTAWAAIAMLSGVAPIGLGDSQTYRLRANLRMIADPAELSPRLRNRAVVYTCSGHRSASDNLRQHLVAPGRKRLGLVEDDTAVDGYIHVDRLDEVVHRYRLSEDPTGRITLRATEVDIDFVERLNKLSRTLAAVDAATSLDPRERGVGEEILSRRLELFRENV